MGIEPFPKVKKSSLSTIGSNPYGIRLKLKDVRVGFDPLMCERVTISFNIIYVGATTRLTTTQGSPMDSG
jgi:hypothetical protein